MNEQHLEPRTLRGITCFGFGTLVPLRLAQPRIHTPGQRGDNNNAFASRNSPNNSTLVSPTPLRFYQNVFEEEFDRVRQEAGLEHGKDLSSGSPTRISSLNNVVELGLQKQRPGSPNYIADSCSSGPLVFTEELMAQVAQRAEIGRVTMDIENI